MNRGLRSVLIATGAVLALIVGIGGAAGFAGIRWINARLEERATIDLGSASASTPSASALPLGGECMEDCNYLVLGSDSRAGLSAKDQREFGSDAEIDGYRSDTMLLVHVDREMRHTTIVSFPRDLLVDVPGAPGLEGYGKLNLINSAFSYGAQDGGVDGVEGGAELAAKTVSQLTGLRIHHVVVVDLEAFKSIVDAMGTVPFCTPVELKDDPKAFPEWDGVSGGSGLFLKAGCHDLDGDTALALVRARYVIAGGRKDCISDYARISRQQQFMRAMMNTLLSPEMFPRIPEIIDAATKKLKFDDELDVVDLAELADAMKGIASGDADFRTIPNRLDRNLIHLEITPAGRTFLAKLRNGEPLGDLGTELQYQPPTPAEIAVRVYDDDSEGHAQNDVYKEQLADSGFKMLATAAEPAGRLAGSGTVILYQRGALKEAKVLAGYVPGVKYRAAKAGELPDDTEVGVVVDATYTYKDPGEGATPTVAERCPFT